jgi:hypothetical protein
MSRFWRDLSRSLVLVGGGLLGIGLILVLVKLLMLVAYFAAGAMVLVGLIALLAGLLLGRR